MRELSTQELDLVAGGLDFGENQNTYISEHLSIDKTFVSATFVYGNASTAEANATALGYNSATQTFTSSTSVKGVGSSSSSTSISFV
jgi:hypothetical protein